MNPFGVLRGNVGRTLSKLSRRLHRYGVSHHFSDHGSGRAGFKKPTPIGKFQGENGKTPIGYQIVLNSNHSEELRFASLARELGHLFCGHLGPDEEGRWTSRVRLSREVEEFEAESVSWLVCARAGIESPSEKYLSGYLDAHGKAPPISFDRVLKAVGMIEEMASDPKRR